VAQEMREEGQRTSHGTQTKFAQVIFEHSSKMTTWLLFLFLVLLFIFSATKNDNFASTFSESFASDPVQQLQKDLDEVITLANKPSAKVLLLHQHMADRKNFHPALRDFLYGLAPFVHSLSHESSKICGKLQHRDDLNDVFCDHPNELFDHLFPNESWVETRHGQCHWKHYPILFATQGIPGKTLEHTPFTMQMLRHLSPFRADIDDLKRRGVNQGRVLSAGFLWLQPGDCFNHEAQMVPEELREKNHKIFIIHFQLRGKSVMEGDTTAFSTAHPIKFESKRPEGSTLDLSAGDLCCHNPSKHHVLKCRGDDDSLSLYVYLEVA